MRTVAIEVADASEIIRWCEDVFGDSIYIDEDRVLHTRWFYLGHTFYFESEQDSMMFSMRWS